MTKAEALARLDVLRRAIEGSPVDDINDADLSPSWSGRTPPKIYLPWDEFCRMFSRAESEYDNGCQWLRAEAVGVTWQTHRSLVQVGPQEIELTPPAAHAASEVHP